MIFSAVCLNESREDMMKTNIRITNGKFLPLEFVEGVEHFEYRIQIETVSSSLSYDIHLLFVFMLFKSWIRFVVECSVSRRPNDHDAMVDNWQ